MGQQGKNRVQLMAIVAAGKRRRIYLSPNEKHLKAANVKKLDIQSIELPERAIGYNVQSYGFKSYSDLFTNRQLTIKNLSDIIIDVREEVIKDAIASHLSKDNTSFSTGGFGAKAYSEAISIFLSFS